MRDGANGNGQAGCGTVKSKDESLSVGEAECWVHCPRQFSQFARGSDLKKIAGRI
jgi:hypothetical protein